MLKKLCAITVFCAVLAGCGYVDEYERQVHDWEPVYCYQSLAPPSATAPRNTPMRAAWSITTARTRAVMTPRPPSTCRP